MSRLTSFLGLKADVDIETQIKEAMDNLTSFTTVSYPVYIPSKGRASNVLTAKFLDSENIVNYKLVIEPQDEEEYLKYYDFYKLVILDKNDMGIGYVRNFIKAHSKSLGEEKHWQIDDDIKWFKIRLLNKNVKCSGRSCLSLVESIVDQYTNIGLTGICSDVFAFAKKTVSTVNRLCYTTILVHNQNDLRWAEDGIEDIDYTLKVLDSGLCTLVFNRVLTVSPAVGKQTGGNSEIQYKEEKWNNICRRMCNYYPNKFKVKKDTPRWKIKPTSYCYSSYNQKLERKQCS